MAPAVLSILIGFLVAAVAGTLAHVRQLRRAAVFPAIPSRVETIDAGDAAVRYFGAAHDITNTITSAWNHARATKTDDTMLRELELPALGDHIDVFQASAPELKSKLEEHERLNKALAPVCEALDESWSYNRHDNYRTDVYMVPGPKGKMQTRTRQVYTHTDHYFTFDFTAAARADEAVRSLLSAFDETGLYDAAVAHLEVSFTDDDRIRVWETVYEGRDEKPTEQDVFAAMDAWNDAATAQHRIAEAVANLGILRGSATTSTFDAIRRSRRSYHYVSYGGPGSQHAGPPGYRATQSLLDPTKRASGAFLLLFSAMDASEKHVEELHRMWKEEGRFGDENAGDLAKAMLDHGIEIYKELFPKSVVTYDQRVKHGWTAAIAAGAGLLAGLAAYVIQAI